jgi:hypothetical protein
VAVPEESGVALGHVMWVAAEADGTGVEAA